MPELPSTGPISDRASESRLDSWKEIAAYLRRDVTTVQRWEKREGMPVHRHLHAKLGSVYALPSELDAWSQTRNGDSSARQQPGGWFGNNPIAGAEFAPVADFDGTQYAAAISRDGGFVAFLSKRNGRTDIWVGQIGGRQFYNLTEGAPLDLLNPDVRTVSFTPDGAMVLFWARTAGESAAGRIGIWAVPTLGGQPRPYFDGVSEFDWSESGRLVYHTPEAGDPTFVTDPNERFPGRQIFGGVPGQHAHFPVWSPDEAFIYFVAGIVPHHMDLWRISPKGGAAQRVTFHNSRVTYPVFIDRPTLLYLVGGADGTAPWLYTLDTDRRVPQRIGSAIDHYTSLAVSGNRRRLVATRAHPKTALWRGALTATPVSISTAARVGLTTASGRTPRFAKGGLLYVASSATGDTLWTYANGVSTEVWSAPAAAQIIGGPAVSSDGDRIALSVSDRQRSWLHVMRADGTQGRVVTESLVLHGGPAWAPDGQSIVVAAAADDGTPRLCRISLDGQSTMPILSDYSVDPVWAPDGSFIAYAGAEIGSTFHVKAVTPDGQPRALPNIVLTRGARHIVLLADPPAVVALKMEGGHNELWLIDLETGTERRLTNFGPDVVVRDFDISPDGRDVVIAQVQEHSAIVRIDLPAS